MVEGRGGRKKVFNFFFLFAPIILQLRRFPFPMSGRGS